MRGSCAEHAHGGAEVVTLVVDNGFVCHFAGAYAESVAQIQVVP